MFIMSHLSSRLLERWKKIILQLISNRVQQHMICEDNRQRSDIAATIVVSKFKVDFKQELPMLLRLVKRQL